MKASRTLLFILAVFLLLGISWFFFPAEGIAVGQKSLHFPSYAEDRLGPEEVVDVDAVLENVNKSFEMSVSETLLDSLEFYRDYLTLNPNRIHLPNNDYTYFDSLFYLLEHAQADHKVYRVMHYGDSQIEMDRITSVLRQRMQEMFGGSGPGMISAVKRISSISLTQGYSGNLVRYALVGDSTSRKASHSRYGVMTQFCQTTGQSTVNFSTSKNSQAYDKVREISRVSVLLGNNSEGFRATLKAGNIQEETRSCPAKSGATLLTWELPDNIEKGTITFQGNAEIYGIMLDGGYGVNVDNDALRGCSGTIFTRISKPLMKESFELTDTRMIILQFGGNRMPIINNSKQVSSYMRELDKQVKYFQEVAPQATILFIGPADMGKSYNGKMGSYKMMSEVNDSIMAMALSNNVAYWDMFHVMGGEGSMAQYVKHKPPLGSPDHIHFTFLGAQEMGNDLSKSLIIYHDFYQLRQRLNDEEMLKEFMSKDRELIEQEKEARKNRFEPTKFYYE
jgi:lysophospholipase L1-like esterase